MSTMEIFFLKKRRKLLVIFRGINTNYFNPQKISPIRLDKFSGKHNIDRNKFIILLPGRLTHWKGQKMFIETINLLYERKIYHLSKQLFLEAIREEMFIKNDL